MLKDAQGSLARSEMKLQEQSRIHEEEITRVEGIPSVSVPLSMCNVYGGSDQRFGHIFMITYVYTYV